MAAAALLFAILPPILINLRFLHQKITYIMRCLTRAKRKSKRKDGVYVRKLAILLIISRSVLTLVSFVGRLFTISFIEDVTFPPHLRSDSQTGSFETNRDRFMHKFFSIQPPILLLAVNRSKLILFKEIFTTKCQNIEDVVDWSFKEKAANSPG